MTQFLSWTVNGTLLYLNESFNIPQNAFVIEHDDSLGEPLLRSGRNVIVLRTVAGPVGVYTLQQLSVQVFNKKLDFLAEMNDYT